MAQPVFDDHPLERYLRDSGEKKEYNVPGGALEFMPPVENEDEEEEEEGVTAGGSTLDWLSDHVASLLSSVLSVAQSSTSPPNPFAEKFKYDVISSSLLSNSLSSPVKARRSSNANQRLPGRLSLGSTPGGRSDSGSPLRTSSAPMGSSSILADGSQVANILVTSDGKNYGLSLSTAILLLLLFNAGYHVLLTLVLSLGGALWYFRSRDGSERRAGLDMTSTFDCLNELIDAGDNWDANVHEAFALLENEERNLFYGPSPQPTPSSSVRVALQSSLHTTKTQCDHIRQLLAALTTDREEGKIVGMYAPSPPRRGSFRGGMGGEEGSARPFSLPSGRARRRGEGHEVEGGKRTTWNGSYASLAEIGSPLAERRSGLIDFRAGTSSKMEDTVEEGDEEEMKDVFGSHVMRLRRARKRGGLISLGIPSSVSASASVFTSSPLSPFTSPSSASYSPPSFFHSPSSPWYSRSSGTSTAATSPGAPSTPVPKRAPSASHRSSRMTHGGSGLVQTTRHPLSLGALRASSDAAVGAKRYACSYLLALRFPVSSPCSSPSPFSPLGFSSSVPSSPLISFSPTRVSSPFVGRGEDEGGDEGYWEDVRSVIGLLAGTLRDASGRLSEALSEAVSGDVEAERSFERVDDALDFERMGGEGDEPGFAPVMTRVSRFALHVDAIGSALDDAKEQLGRCVVSLRDASPLSPTTSSPSFSSLPSLPDEPALAAYERMRREIGIALRECERGRERLLELLRPRAPSSELVRAEEQGEGGVPPLSRTSTEEETPADVSDEDSGVFGSPTAVDVGNDDIGVVVEAKEGEEEEEGGSVVCGLEQVFEAHTGLDVGDFGRERSKLSRAERILLVKAKRESLHGSPSLDSFSTLCDAMEGEGVRKKKKRGMVGGWGPGGEVVQELKDVIWKVGERRRKLVAEAEARPLAESHGVVGMTDARSLSVTSPSTFSKRTATPPSHS